MSVTIAKWTINGYHSMINAGLLDHRQVELLKGEIVEMSPELTYGKLPYKIENNSPSEIY